MKNNHRTLRIIGGKWRGRKVTFPENPDIRPTSDRVRETLFNWLMQDAPGATCLDLFAGSGILGIEALSRGARQVTFVERDATTAKTTGDNLKHLGADPACYTIIGSNAERWLGESTTSFDIIFLDPPFVQFDINQLLMQVASMAQPCRLVYLESPAPTQSYNMPQGWQIHRAKTAGAVHYGLIKTNEAAPMALNE